MALPATPGEPHFPIASENYARGSIASLPAGHTNMHAKETKILFLC